jgi:4-hydroxy-tetrahydrodipicolinate synthase
MFSGSLVALVTPMQPDGSIDWVAWDRLLDLHLEAGTAGIVVGGTTGESATLTEPELLALVEHARRRVKTRLALIAGTGGSSTTAAVERVRRLSAAGVDALLIVTPPYNRPTQEGLYRHFEAAAAASAVPILLYNVPSRTGVDLLPATVARLARLPRIVGIKEAANAGRARELLEVTDDGFTVLSGDDASAAEAMLSGARGVISVTANVVPKAMVQLCAAAVRGDRVATARIDSSLAALHAALFVESNPIPVKWALAELGLIGYGIRLPLTALSEPLQTSVRAALEPVQRRSPTSVPASTSAEPAADAPARGARTIEQVDPSLHGSTPTQVRLA